MKRIIREFTPPAPTQAGIFSVPDNAVAIQYDGKLYADYLTINATENPQDAFYVGEMLPDGSVTDIQGDASQFPHCFLGWDRRTTDSEKVANLVITPRQARLALLQNNLLTNVNALVAAQPEIVRIQWEYAIDIKRTDPLVNSMLTYLGQTPAQIDALFVLAATF